MLRFWKNFSWLLMRFADLSIRMVIDFIRFFRIPVVKAERGLESRVVDRPKSWLRVLQCTIRESCDLDDSAVVEMGNFKIKVVGGERLPVFEVGYFPCGEFGCGGLGFSESFWRSWGPVVGGYLSEEQVSSSVHRWLEFTYVGGFVAYSDLFLVF